MIRETNCAGRGTRALRSHWRAILITILGLGPIGCSDATPTLPEPPSEIARPPLALSVSDVPALWLQGRPITLTVRASGGTGDYRFYVAEGALPPGVSLLNDGTITGTPLAAGSYAFTLRVTSGSQSATQPVAVRVDPPPLVLPVASLPVGIQGNSYDQSLSASGGTGEYSWSLEEGSMPAGLTLSSNGRISGTPSAVGTFNFTTRVVSGTLSATAELSITIAPAPARITTTRLDDGWQGSAYEFELTATGGTGTYSWSLSAGRLPPGLSLAPTGRISGTPTTSGDFGVQVRVSSGVQDATSNFVLSVRSAPIVRIDIDVDTVMTVDSSYRVAGTAIDSRGVARPDATISLVLSDTSLAVAAEGNEIRVRRPGSVTITASCGEVTAARNVALLLDAVRYADSRVFSYREYLRQNSDLPAFWSYDAALRHWLQHGAAAGRAAHSNFRLLEYVAINSISGDVTRDGVFRAIPHYLTFGVAQSLSASARAPSSPFAVFKQPTFDQVPAVVPYIAAWNTGAAPIFDRPAGDLSQLTGLVVAGQRASGQWQLPGGGGAQGGFPSVVQQYNGWIGVSIDTRSTQAARALSGWPSDDPVAFNFGLAYKGSPTALPRPFAAPNRGLVWEGEIQVPQAESQGNNGAYIIVYHLLRDRTSDTYLWFGVVVFDSRGAALAPTYVAYDACAACTQFLVVSSHLGATVDWHSRTPTSIAYTGRSFRTIRDVGFRVSGEQLTRAIRAAKASTAGLDVLSDDPSDYFLHNWNIDFELGPANLGQAFLTSSFRLRRAEILR